MKFFLGRHVLIFLILIAFLFITCREKTDEEMILEMMNELGKLAEKEDINGILAHMDEDYRDFRGRRKEETRDMLQGYFDQFRGIVIHMLSTRIVERKASEAFIQTELAVSSGGARIIRRVIRVSTDNYRLNLRLAKMDSRWLIRYAEWKHITLDELFPESLAILKKIMGKD